MLKLLQVSAETAVPVTAEVEAAAVVVAGLSVFGFVMEAEELGTAEKARRWLVYLEQHSGVSEESTLDP